MTKELKRQKLAGYLQKSIISVVITLFLGFIIGIVSGDKIDMGSAHSIGVALGSGALGKFVSDYLG
ncbi:MAG: hypothetical protein IPK76_14935 [Lewinellaceae bacterium]|nr:hypothetical protein [Lewinellaceae bacterium]